jgi:hypothetical protein
LLKFTFYRPAPETNTWIMAAHLQLERCSFYLAL